MPTLQELTLRSWQLVSKLDMSGSLHVAVCTALHGAILGAILRARGCAKRTTFVLPFLHPPDTMRFFPIDLPFSFSLPDCYPLHSHLSPLAPCTLSPAVPSIFIAVVLRPPGSFFPPVPLRTLHPNCQKAACLPLAEG